LGKLVAVVGSAGVGKTALVRALCRDGDFACGLEQHGTRPFQSLAAREPRFIFANQVDYLLLRAHQERELRRQSRTGLLDGGLDMDFHGFTRLFHARFWLTDAEFDLCRRLYEYIRFELPLPDLVIMLVADESTIVHRLEERRRINIASGQDISRLTAFLEEWLSGLGERLLRLDVSADDPGYRRIVPRLLPQIIRMLGQDCA